MTHLAAAEWHIAEHCIIRDQDDAAVGCALNHGANFDQFAVNTRLIAAAPELLRIAKMYVANIEPFTLSHKYAIEAAAALIKNIEGTADGG